MSDQGIPAMLEWDAETGDLMLDISNVLELMGVPTEEDESDDAVVDGTLTDVWVTLRVLERMKRDGASEADRLFYAESALRGTLDHPLLRQRIAARIKARRRQQRSQPR